MRLKIAPGCFFFLEINEFQTKVSAVVVLCIILRALLDSCGARLGAPYMFIRHSFRFNVDLCNIIVVTLPSSFLVHR